MSTYDILKPWWEQAVFTDPCASTTFTFFIILAMIILWTQTLQENKN